MNLFHKSIRYIILFALETGWGLLTIYCLQIEGNQYNWSISAQNMTRNISHLFIVIINILWALIVMRGTVRNKIISGLLCGILVLLTAIAVTRFCNPDINNLIFLAAVFAGQIIFWEIYSRISPVQFKIKNKLTLKSTAL